MVRGDAMAVTAVALMYQWADTMRMARGRGIDAPNAAHASLYRLRSRAFIGLPCPKNTAGRAAAMYHHRRCSGQVANVPRVTPA